MGPGPRAHGPVGPQTRSLNYFFRRHFWHFLETRSVNYFSGAIFDIQVWNEEGAGLRRVRFLKNDISFFILVISVSFWTPQAWNEEGAGLRRVRFLKNDMSWNEKSKLLRDARNADNSRNPPAPRPNLHLGRDKPVVETPHWDFFISSLPRSL